jgi:hypothetical protein
MGSLLLSPPDPDPNVCGVWGETAAMLHLLSFSMDINIRKNAEMNCQIRGTPIWEDQFILSPFLGDWDFCRLISPKSYTFSLCSVFGFKPLTQELDCKE